MLTSAQVTSVKQIAASSSVCTGSLLHPEQASEQDQHSSIARSGPKLHMTAADTNKKACV